MHFFQKKKNRVNILSHLKQWQLELIPVFKANQHFCTAPRLLPERFGHAPQVFILLLQPFELGQDLGELSAGALWMLAVPHQVTADVEEECAPGQQHQGNPTP